MAARCEPTYKVTVEVATLIEKVEAVITRLRAQHVKALEKHERDLAVWRPKAEYKLLDLIERLQAGKDIQLGSYGNPNIPAKPSKPYLQLGQAEKDLALLKAAREQVITIKGQDYLASYL